MNYLSVCSGIEAASVAWEPLGMQPVGFAEIDAFPSAVLAHRFPHVRNFGDFTEIENVECDVLVGGTPCQSFSVAGLRGGLDDERGNLALEFIRLAQRLRPSWVVWENVPGVLSSGGGRDFGTFLGGLAECGYGFAYRVLDAQYFGVPQRRRRVFVVGYLGDWRRAAAVLFERHSLQGHPAPSREAGKVAPSVPSRRTAGGGLGTDFDCDGGLIPSTANPLTHRMHKGINTTCDEGQTLLAQQRCEFCGYAFNRERLGKYGCPNCLGEGIEVSHSLRGDGFDASEDGTGRGTPLVPIAFAQNQLGEVRAGAVMGTLNQNQNASGRNTAMIAYQCQGSNVGPMGHLRRGNGNETGGVPFVFDWQSGGDARGLSPQNTAQLQREQVPATMQGMAVRRLTPRECERLQGFPDDWTLVPYRNGMAKDGPRYKAIGNSMAVPVMRWIGERLKAQQDADQSAPEGITRQPASSRLPIQPQPLTD